MTISSERWRYDDLYNPDSATPALAGETGTKMKAYSGDFSRYLGTVNGFYDLPVTSKIIPYIGGGFGFAHATGTTSWFRDAAGHMFYEPIARHNIAVALGEFGGTVRVNGSWSIVPAYRYIHYFDSGNALGEDAHIFKLGLRYASDLSSQIGERPTRS